MAAEIRLCFSDEWEMGVPWHVTRKPASWVRLYVRRRYVDTVPLATAHRTPCNATN